MKLSAPATIRLYKVTSVAKYTSLVNLPPFQFYLSIAREHAVPYYVELPEADAIRVAEENEIFIHEQEDLPDFGVLLPFVDDKTLPGFEGV